MDQTGTVWLLVGWLLGSHKRATTGVTPTAGKPRLGGAAWRVYHPGVSASPAAPRESNATPRPAASKRISTLDSIQAESLI
jgi:hypothetical protein